MGVVFASRNDEANLLLPAASRHITLAAMNLRKLRERLFKASHERNAIQRFIVRKYLFGFFQACGIHVTGDHFYEIVPNTKLVAQKYSEQPREFPSIDWRFDECENRALELVKKYGGEFKEAAPRFGFREKNYYFRGMDALLLYCLLRDLKPAKMVEIGQGFSTRITLAALERNALETGQSPFFLSIDPYPRFVPKDVPECLRMEVIQQEAQKLDLDPVLKDCAFLFIDSSHVYKFGSDVAFEFVTLYSRLAPGTILHLHDIFSPYEYPRKWIVENRFFWNEQYFLECFLMFNSVFQIHLPVHYLARSSSAVVEAIRRLPLDERFEFSGSSFYLRRT